MVGIPTLSNIAFHRDARVSAFSSRATTTPLAASAPLTSVQRRELGNVLIHLDNIENALKSSGRNTTETLIESVNASTSVKSSVLAINADNPISQKQLANQVVNGSFEEDVITRAFAQLNNITGWSNSANGGIEVWRDIPNMPAIQGNQHIELDVQGGMDTLDQNVATVPGQIYEFSFAYAARLNVNEESNEVEIFFDGELLDTISGNGNDRSELDWNVYSFTVEATSAESVISFRETSSNGVGILLDAVSLTESTKAVGTSSANEVSTVANQVVLSDAAIQSGSIAINNKSINIDVDNDTLHDIVDSINAAKTGVTATLVSAGVNAENQTLYTIDLASDNGGFSLKDNGTGLFAAIGLETGAYGQVYETTTYSGRKVRGYRAANALEGIQESLKNLFKDESTSGSLSLKSSLSEIFSDLADRYGESKILALGLDLTEFEEGFLDISKQSRKRFAKAVYEDDNRLEKILLKSYTSNEEGLIDAIRETVKAELKNNGGSIGSIVNTYA